MKLLLYFVLLVSILSGQLQAEEPLTCWPDYIGQYVHQNIGGADTIGFSSSQMANFPGYSHRLGYVSQLFRNAESLPQETNSFAQQMLASSVNQAVSSGMRLLGSRIAAEQHPQHFEVRVEPASAADAETWKALPPELHSIVQQLVHSLVAARPLLHQSFDWDALSCATGDANLNDLGSSRVYHYAAAPWLGSAWGTSSYAALNSFQATPLGNAAAQVFATVDTVLGELKALDTSNVIEFDTCRLRTSAGNVTILGCGNNRYSGRDAVTIDLGGDDHYSGRLAVPVAKLVPVGLVIDVRGNDTYDGGSQAASLACGLFGIGALFDLDGNDQYTCDSSGIGCAWHGIGLVYDAQGNDVYRGRQWTQAARMPAWGW